MNRTILLVGLLALGACSDPVGPTEDEPPPTMAPVDIVPVPSFMTKAGKECTFPFHMNSQECFEALILAGSLTTSYMAACARLQVAACIALSGPTAAAWWNFEAGIDQHGHTGPYDDLLPPGSQPYDFYDNPFGYLDPPNDNSEGMWGPGLHAGE